MEFLEPKRLKEANIQAELYRQLKNYDINCYLEYPLKKEGHGKLRADCVIMDKEKKRILAVVEVKSYVRKTNKPYWNTKQMKRYRVFYDGVIMVYDDKTIKTVINWLKKYHWKVI